MIELELVREELLNKAVRYLREAEGIEDANRDSLRDKKHQPLLKSFYRLQRGREERADYLIQGFLQEIQ